MVWKNNKWVGVAAVIITLICFGFMVLLPILTNLREKTRQKAIRQTEEYKKWREYENRAIPNANKEKF